MSEQRHKNCQIKRNFLVSYRDVIRTLLNMQMEFFEEIVKSF